MRVFWKKAVKITNPRLLPADSRVVSLAYYYNLIQFVSSARCVLSPRRKITRL